MLLGLQSLGEYAGASGGGLGAELASSVQNTARWVQMSLREDRSLWIAAAVCLVLSTWVFRRR
jgi:hypothetical protein